MHIDSEANGTEDPKDDHSRSRRLQRIITDPLPHGSPGLQVGAVVDVGFRVTYRLACVA